MLHNLELSFGRYFRSLVCRIRGIKIFSAFLLFYLVWSRLNYKKACFDCYGRIPISRWPVHPCRGEPPVWGFPDPVRVPFIKATRSFAFGPYLLASPFTLFLSVSLFHPTSEPYPVQTLCPRWLLGLSGASKPELRSWVE